jgi:hypothetical protein
VGQFGDNLEASIGALLKPSESDWEKIQKTFELVPGVDVALRVVAVGRGWFFDGEKAERVKPVLLGLYERIAKLEADATEYIRKPEARATIEEVLTRIGDQPDRSRRQDMERVLYKILEQPRDLAENRMFIRLADELPVLALKLLAATHASVGHGVRASVTQELGNHAGVPEGEREFWLKYLVNQGLLDEGQIGHVQRTTYEGVLTPLGRAFEQYRRA